MQMQILFTWDHPRRGRLRTVRSTWQYTSGSGQLHGGALLPTVPLSQKSCAMRQIRMMYSLRSASHGYHAEILAVSSPPSYFNRRLTTARSWFEPPNRSRTAYLQSHLRLAGLGSCVPPICSAAWAVRRSSTGTPYSRKTCSLGHTKYQYNGRSRRPLSVSNANARPTTNDGGLQ